MSKGPRDLSKEVELRLDRCTLRYGEGACEAELGVTGAAKCFNTRATCQDPDNYSPEPHPLVFIRPEAFAEAGKIPSLNKVEIRPSKLAGGTGGGSALGERGKATASFADHAWSDHLTDKYRDERADGTAGEPAYDPIEVGTFWGKFRARNRFYLGRPFVWRGGIGDDVRERQYVIERVDVSGGAAQVVAKDPLKLADDERAQCPRASSGQLASAISDTATSLTLTPAGIGNEEYPSSGTASIGQELVEFTRSGDSITLTARGVNGVQEEHAELDTFQIAKVFSAERPDDIVFELLTEFAPVPSDLIPTAKWAAEVNGFIPQLYSAIIAKPTSVKQLVGELAEQAGFGVAWDDLRQEIIFVAVKAPEATAVVIDDDRIVDGSINISEDPRKRISRMWTAIGQIDPVSDLEEDSNYRTFAITVDPTAEEADEWNQPAIKKIFSRWIPQFGLSIAQDLNLRLVSRFRDIPRDVRFQVRRADIDDITLGETRFLETRRIQDEFGRPDRIIVRILSVAEDEDVLTIEAEEQLFIPQPGIPRRVVVSADTENFNLRAEHDELFGPASDGDTVICEVVQGVTVGSTTANTPSFDTGDWPAGVNIEIRVDGNIFGRGGVSGRAGDAANGYDGYDGGDGGTALRVRAPIDLENNGVIGGGGGAGGGGGTAFAQGGDTAQPGGEVLGQTTRAGGGGGGGAAGVLNRSGATGESSVGQLNVANGQDGADGGNTFAGGGGVFGTASTQYFDGDSLAGTLDLFGGLGGGGGGLGQNGGNGTNASSNNDPGFGSLVLGQGGDGGDAGPAIDGVSLVTITASGSIIGPQIN